MDLKNESGKIRSDNMWVRKTAIIFKAFKNLEFGTLLHCLKFDIH